MKNKRQKIGECTQCKAPVYLDPEDWLSYLYPEFSCDCPEEERAVWAGDPDTTFQEVKQKRDERAKKEVYG